MRELLADEYGLQVVAVSRLGGEVDTNLRVDCADGTQYVVKTSPPGADEQLIEWQLELLERVDTVPVPRIIRTHKGDRIVKHAGSVTRVFGWLPGAPMDAITPHSPELLASWGATAARLVRALADVAPMEHKHHWEVLRSAESIARHGSDDSTVQTILEWFVDARSAHGDALPRQVVHQDLNDFNVLADGDRVCGVIDFADALHTARIGELAVAVAYSMLRKDDPLAAARHLVRGYTAIADLEPAERAVLWPFACARLCVNLVTWTARRDSNPDYAQARMRNTAAALARIVRHPPAAAYEYLVG